MKVWVQNTMILETPGMAKGLPQRLHPNQKVVKQAHSHNGIQDRFHSGKQARSHSGQWTSLPLVCIKLALKMRKQKSKHQ